MKNKFFLGGTCADSVWRQELITILETQGIDYFNPVVTDWKPSDRQNEETQKAECKYLLYFITPRQTGVYSFAEIMDSCHKAHLTNQKVIYSFSLYDRIVLNDSDNLSHRKDGNFYTWTDSEKKSLEAVAKLVVDSGNTYIPFVGYKETYTQIIESMTTEVLGDRPIILALDFDDTICSGGFPDIQNGKLIEGAKETINQLYDHGYYIIIWTARFLENHIKDCCKFLDDNEIKYHAINKNCPQLEFQPYPKIFYDFLLDDKCLLKMDWKNVHEFINVKTTKCDVYTITDEMRNQYYTRTMTHVDLVKKYWFKYFQSEKCILDNQILSCSDNHDNSKFYTPELNGYILTAWNYYCKDNNIELDITPEMFNLMNEATLHHIKTNHHHPEFWTDRVDVVPQKDRDKFDPDSVPTIDSSKMPDTAIIQMVSDWCAMSEERNNTPREWADKVIGKRWSFTPEQVELIYETIDIMWSV